MRCRSAVTYENAVKDSVRSCVSSAIASTWTFTFTFMVAEKYCEPLLYMYFIILLCSMFSCCQHPAIMAEDDKPRLPDTLTEDDSCIAGYIEIVPLDSTRVGYCNEVDCCSEIKQEPVDDIKHEVDEVHEVCSVKDEQVGLCLCICLLHPSVL